MVDLSLRRILGKEESMKDLNPKRNKHLTSEERQEIQYLLDRRVSFKAITKIIGKDQTTISKEVKKHMIFGPEPTITRDNQGKEIHRCCPELLRAPFVCNGCKSRHHTCGYAKRYYRADKAQKDYKALLKEAREGIPLNKDEFYKIDEIVSDGIKKGQRLYHIVETNKENIQVSMSTIYRHIKLGYLSTLPIDLPRAVKFKPRKSKHRIYVPKAAKEGRTHTDFLAYTEENTIFFLG